MRYKIITLYLALTGCHINTTTIEKYYYQLNDQYLKFAECLGEDSKENRKKMISNISNNNHVIDFYDPCNGGGQQLGYYKSSKEGLLFLNRYQHNVLEQNGGLITFKIVDGKITQTDDQIFKVSMAEINESISTNQSFKKMKDEFGDSPPLAISLGEQSIHVIFDPEFSDGSITPIVTIDLNM